MNIDPDKKKKLQILGITIALMFLYFFVFPMFWPEPEMDVRIPGEVNWGQDATIDVTVSSVHSNFQVYHAYLVLDRSKSSSLAPSKQTLLPVTLYQGKKVQNWPYMKINRLTFPQKKKIQFKIPLQKLEGEGVIERGNLNGFLRIEMCFVKNLLKTNRIPMGGYRGKDKQKKIDFDIKIK